jgi:hypothetical protein
MLLFTTFDSFSKHALLFTSIFFRRKQAFEEPDALLRYNQDWDWDWDWNWAFQGFYTLIHHRTLGTRFGIWVYFL